MSKKLEVAREAEWDFDDAFAWYEAKRPGLGLEFREDIDDALARIVEHPHAFEIAPQTPEYRDARRCVANRFPYQVIFVEEDDSILIVAIAHQQRLPGYWRGRR